MFARRRCLLLGGLLAIAAQATAQDVQWRAVGSPKPPSIVAVQAIEPPAVTQPAKTEAPASPAPVTTPPAASPRVVVPNVPVETLDKTPPSNGIVVPPTPEADFCGPLPLITGPCPVQAAACECGSQMWNFSAGPSDHRFWVSGEFLGWYTKGANGPVLLTTSTRAFPFTTNAAGNPVLNPRTVGNIGALNDSSTVVLLDTKDLDDQFRAGGRFSAGWWFDPCGCNGVDASFFFTSRRNSSFTANTDEFPALYRPFFAVNPGLPETGGVPGETREIVGVRAIGLNSLFQAQSTSFFWGADANYRRNLWQGCAGHIDGFVGFRYLHLDESLSIAEGGELTQPLTFLDGTGAVATVVPAGTRIDISDRFSTKNNFYGGQVGADMELRRDRWSLDLRPSIALGATEQQLTVVGTYHQSLNGVPVAAFPAGLFALSSNSGHRSNAPFTYVPEVSLKLGYDVTANLRVTVGYDFLYWSSVIRPGDQIDRGLDTALTPPPGGTTVVPARPAPLFQTTDFWAQGINTGLEYRW